MSDNNLEHMVRIAHDLADMAATIAKKYFRADVPSWDKPDQTPVSQADQEIEIDTNRRVRTACVISMWTCRNIYSFLDGR